MRLTCCYYSKMIQFKAAVSEPRICMSALTVINSWLQQRLSDYICITTFNSTKPWAPAQVEIIHAAHLLAYFAPCYLSLHGSGTIVSW